MKTPHDPRHQNTRAALRVIGPAVALVGLVFTIIGMVSFFSSFGSFEPPRYFWCAFIGLPLLGIGAMICKFAYLGAVTRYLANEVAPVGKDVINYMADGTQGAVRTLAAAAGEGIRSGMAGEALATVRCSDCGVENETPANFCKGCGAPLATAKACSGCGKENAKDARFCTQCGQAMDQIA